LINDFRVDTLAGFEDGFAIGPKIVFVDFSELIRAGHEVR
jgi:hypothetical protein